MQVDGQGGWRTLLLLLFLLLVVVVVMVVVVVAAVAALVVVGGGGVVVVGVVVVAGVVVGSRETVVFPTLRKSVPYARRQRMHMHFGTLSGNARNDLIVLYRRRIRDR